MSTTAAKIKRKRRGKLSGDIITLAHGSGGKAMRDLIDDVFVSTFDNFELAKLEDQARIPIEGFAGPHDHLAMTTDSYVVDPLFFPGGDIGKLAVSGTVNDLAVSGAVPKYLSCGMIIEEGLSIDTLRKVAVSMKTTADQAGVLIVTGDTKVVHRGNADKLFINTAGIGVVAQGITLGAHLAQPGDVIIINGEIGNHGAAIVDARGEFAMENTILSDCQPLNDLIQTMIGACPTIRCMRDATRGGIATVLNEFAEASQVGIRVQENTLPIRIEVRGMCEILGLDPLYLANEGKLLAVVAASDADALLEVMKAHPMGKQSTIIGTVIEQPVARVILNTSFGGERIVDMLVGEQLPRIC